MVSILAECNVEPWAFNTQLVCGQVLVFAFTACKIQICTFEGSYSRVQGLESKDQKSVQDISREEKKREASRPLYLIRYE